MKKSHKISLPIVSLVLVILITACQSGEPIAETQGSVGEVFHFVTTQGPVEYALAPTQSVSSLPAMNAFPTMSPEALNAAWVDSVYSYKDLYKPAIAIGQSLLELNEQLPEDQRILPLVDIQGQEIKFDGKRTVLVLGVPGCPPCEEVFPLIKAWANEIGDNTQIVYAVRGRNIDDFIQRLDELKNVRIVNDSDTRLAAALSARAAPSLFLISDDATILWRMTGFFPQHGLELDKVIRQFAASQELNTYYWEANFTDPEAVPNILLPDQNGTQQEVSNVLAGNPTLILFLRNECPECKEIMPPVFEIAKNYSDEDLQLLIILDYFTDEERDRALNYYSTQKVEANPVAKAFLERVDDPETGIEYYSQFLGKGEIQTQLLLDPDSQLSIFWAVTGVPFALLTDRDGTVVDYLPFVWFSQTLEETPTVSPTLEVLKYMLDEILNNSG